MLKSELFHSGKILIVINLHKQSVLECFYNLYCFPRQNRKYPQNISSKSISVPVCLFLTPYMYVCVSVNFRLVKKMFETYFICWKTNSMQSLWRKVLSLMVKRCKNIISAQCCSLLDSQTSMLLALSSSLTVSSSTSVKYPRETTLDRLYESHGKSMVNNFDLHQQTTKVLEVTVELS